MTNSPLVGSTVLIEITVTDPTTGDPADANVDLDIVDPSGIVTSESPSNPSTGVYTFALELTEAGWWTAVWSATSGSLTTVKECTVCATDSALVVVS